LLRQELVHTRKKLETLLAEKEKAEDNVHRIQKVLESERTQLREVLKQAKQKIVVTEEARTTAETSLAKEKEKVISLEDRLRKQDLTIVQLEEEIEALKRQLQSSRNETADCCREKNHLEVQIQMKTQEFESLTLRHTSEMNTMTDRLTVSQEASEQAYRERSGLQETLDRLRETLAQQTQELKAAAERIRETTNERDLVMMERDKKDVEITSINADLDTSNREIVTVSNELKDAITEQERRGAIIATLSAELEALKRKSGADVDNEKQRFANLEARLTKSEEERALLEAKIAELRKQLAMKESQVEAEKRSVSTLRSEVDALTRDRQSRDQRIDILQAQLDELKRQMSSLRSELDEAISARKKAELAISEGGEAHKQTLVQMRMRMIRATVHLLYEIMERRHAIFYTCSFYFWAQYAADANLARGAEELSQITSSAVSQERIDNHEQRQSDITANLDEFEIEGMDIYAAAREFGL